MPGTEKKYKGIVIPAVTPLTKRYKLDKAAAERIFNYFYEHDCAPFILGTTGESASLTFDLKKKYIKLAGKLKKTKSMLYAGIASNCFEESVELARISFDNGVDAVAATLPSYYALTNDQAKTYFENLADAIAGPLIIYNIPATTHTSIPLELIDELSHHEYIVGTKDSERSDERLNASIALWKNRSDFSHFLGWAARSAKALIDGSDGLIPSTGNLNSAIYQSLKNAADAGETDKAFAAQEISDKLGNLYQGGRTLGESLWALKVLMQKESLCKEYVMPPLQPQSKEAKTKLLSEYGALMNENKLNF